MSDFKEFIEAYEKVIHPEDVAFGMKYFKMIQGKLEDIIGDDTENSAGAFLMIELLSKLGLKKESGAAYYLQEEAVDKMWSFTPDAIFDFMVNGKDDWFEPEYKPIMNDVLKVIMKYVKANDWSSLNDDVKKLRIKELIFDKIPNYLT